MCHENVWHTLGMRRKLLARALAVGQVWLSLSSCVSVKTTGSHKADFLGGGVSVRVFADDDARRAGASSPAAVVGELQRRDGATWLPIFRSLSPSWAVAGLPAGTYRIHFPARLDESGNVVRLSADPKEVRVEEGEVVEVQAVLEHVPTALVVLAVVTVVVAAVLLVDWLDDHDVPVPPLPPPELAEAAFYVSLDLASAGWVGVWDSSSPAVTSHFPASGAVVAARRVRVVFAMTEPLEPGELDALGVSVLGEASGIVPGVVSYDGEHWWVVWQPKEDLARGDTFHVTLAADAVEDRSGNELTAPVTFVFRSAD
jgi:hypothetical protein